MAERKPCGLDVPTIPKGARPNAAQAPPWGGNQLAGGNEQRRTVIDFGGPKGWPPAAPTSSVKRDEKPGATGTIGATLTGVIALP